MRQTSIIIHASRQQTDASRPQLVDGLHAILFKAAGSALIGLVVAILVFSVLAAAIVPMVGSSSQQAALADAAAKAYLMAESGFRYAASEFLHGGTNDIARNNTLEALDGNYTLSDGQSRFVLKVYSYFYEILDVQSSPPSAITLTLRSPGSVDVAEIAPGGSIEDRQIRMGNETYTLDAASTAGPGEDDNVTMVITNPLSTPAVGSVIYPVASVNNVQQDTIAGQNIFNIVCRSDETRMFPRRNGRINVNGAYLTYRLKDDDSDTLIDVRDPDTPDTPLTGLALPPNSEVILAPHVRLESTGIYGSGGTEVRRTVVYHTPLTLSGTSVRQVALTDTFEGQPDDWADTAGTQTATGSVGGGGALQVQSTVTPGGSQDEGSLTAFNPVTPQAAVIDFNASRSDAGGFLSYETQLKIGYQATTPAPPGGYFPAAPIPAFAAAGLAFRLGGLDPVTGNIFNVNTYGISFLRGDDSLIDGIPDDIVPIQAERLMVLWQQTGNGTDRQWLAYKEMADFFFDEDFETTNQFHQQVGTRWDPETGGRQRGSSTRNWYYGNDVTHTYDFGDTDFGVIQSDPIDLPAGLDAALTFWSWHETEPGRFATHDLKQVFIREDSGGSLGPRQLIRTINDRGAAPGDWYQERLDLSSFAGKTIRIEFSFNTVDDDNNDFEGWYIDDARVFYQWPVQETTLGVRLQEALVVPFEDGTSKIFEGDRIFGDTLGTIGTVLAPPMVTSGDWTPGSPAEGTLLLNSVASVAPGDAFDGDGSEVLFAISGTGRAVVSNTYDDANDRQANVIKTYYAAADGSGLRSGNSTPLDRDTEPYGRLGLDPSLTELQWPPDLDEDGNWTDDDGNWTTDEDYFRLIDWDGVNTASVTGLSTLAFASAAQGVITNSVIQSSHPDLESPLVFGTGNPELGLHTFGDGAENVFFEDFGIRLIIGAEDIVPIPVQQ